MMLSFITVTIMSCSSKPSPSKVYKWKMHACVPESATLYQGYLLPFIEELKKRSNGQLQITPYPASAIVAPSELLIATAEGVVECAMGSTAYDTGLIPEAYAATNLPYGWADTNQPTDFWYKNDEAWGILDRAYQAKNIKLIALLNPDEPLTFFTMFPVNGISDFKGKLIRAAGNWSSFVSNTGASQVTMSISEVYEGLEKGVIDGVFMAISGLSDYKWDEIVRYVMMPPVLSSGGGTNIIVNMDAFKSLTPELQKIFIDTAREMETTHMIPFTRDESAKTIEGAKAKGVKFITLPETEIALMREVALGMWKDIEAINPETARQVKLIKNYLDDKGTDYPGKESKKPAAPSL